ncbi:hypothetical protein SH661x_002252 [Planctomicrobium sp. SH661]|uniref:hypothetical protein n=1 Tax=Planctomicrobium sp. SH661 TaxID=3448124 RepID=UPI003F5C7250
MKNRLWAILGLGVLTGSVQAQDAAYIPQATQDVGYGGAYNGPGSVGHSEPLFRYDDQERWKHGWIQNMPYYEGFHSFRPYNYHHVFSQAQTSAGWGMPATMPYSQQFWHRYEKMTDLSRGDHSPVAPYVPPPKEWDHYPKPLRPGTYMPPEPAEPMPQPGGPVGGLENGTSYAPPQRIPSAILPAQATSWDGVIPGSATPLYAPF